MKEKIKNYSINFIKEIIPVIAGILIALFIDNWNDTQKDKKYIEQVFSTINNELKETNEEIDAIIPQQESLIDSLDFYAKNNNVNIIEIVRKSKGIKIPKIKINAWKSVSSAKIDLLNYNKITSLSDIEEQKENLKDKTEYLMTYLYSNFYQTEESKKTTLKILLMDIIQTEKTTKELINSIENK
ncbi:hypothetical protein [Elizabethkingia anophelis]|uniref:hypothetical protein n=1 Tax=Elizabethkingia anophelis TaxID=1117645 RepID=UPI000442CB14|nr:hypothetical protein [Elizabethkingia anophelis]CDN74591.1 conserved hypothetical protein [Elizabethkingia anophelis]CDN79691.1 conserved hypothetical protein [Elizabethkingia anophelis]